MTKSPDADLEALRQTLLAEGIGESADASTSLGRGAALQLTPTPSELPPATQSASGAEADYVVAFAGALRPSVIDELCIGLSVAVPLAALVLARRARGDDE